MPNTDTTNVNRILFIFLALVCLALSQLSGYLVNSHLDIGESYQVNSFLDISHVRNYGGVFGSFHGKGWLFASFSIVLLSGLSAYVLLNKNLKRYEYICFGIILGAGMSNVLDRFIYGSVIDFINVKGIPYWNYVFNTADTFIHVGVWPLIFFSLLEIKRGRCS